MDIDMVKRSAEASSPREQISSMVMLKITMMEKHLETKGVLAENKNQQKEAKWEKICTFKGHKIAFEEQKRKDNKIAEEDRFLMMDLSGMEPMATKFYELKRMEIMF